jgi:hypothetical protein
MYDTGLHDCLREDDVDRIGKTLQAVDDGDENVAVPVLRQRLFRDSAPASYSACAGLQW